MSEEDIEPKIDPSLKEEPLVAKKKTVRKKAVKKAPKADDDNVPTLEGRMKFSPDEDSQPPVKEVQAPVEALRVLPRSPACINRSGAAIGPLRSPRGPFS